MSDVLGFHISLKSYKIEHCSLVCQLYYAFLSRQRYGRMTNNIKRKQTASILVWDYNLNKNIKSTIYSFVILPVLGLLILAQDDMNVNEDPIPSLI